MELLCCLLQVFSHNLSSLNSSVYKAFHDSGPADLSNLTSY